MNERARTINREVGERIRRLRKERKMTLPQLAAAADTSKGGLFRIETGSGNPTVATLSQIATALNLEIGDLL